MAAMLKPSTEYNRRAAIIEGLRAGRSATEIIRFFGYPRSIVPRSSMPARKITRKNIPRGPSQSLKGAHSSADFG